MVNHVQVEIGRVGVVAEGDGLVEIAGLGIGYGDALRIDAGGRVVKLDGSSQAPAIGNGAVGHGTGRENPGTPEIMIDLAAVIAFHLEAAAVAEDIIAYGKERAAAGGIFPVDAVTGIAANVVEAHQDAAVVSGANRDGVFAKSEVVGEDADRGAAFQGEQVAAGGGAGATVDGKILHCGASGDAQHGLAAKAAGVGQAGIIHPLQGVGLVEQHGIGFDGVIAQDGDDRRSRLSVDGVFKPGAEAVCQVVAAVDIARRIAFTGGAIVADISRGRGGVDIQSAYQLGALRPGGAIRRRLVDAHQQGAGGGRNRINAEGKGELVGEGAEGKSGIAAADQGVAGGQVGAAHPAAFAGGIGRSADQSGGVELPGASQHPIGVGRIGADLGVGA